MPKTLGKSAQRAVFLPTTPESSGTSSNSNTSHDEGHSITCPNMPRRVFGCWVHSVIRLSYSRPPGLPLLERVSQWPMVQGRTESDTTAVLLVSVSHLDRSTQTQCPEHKGPSVSSKHDWNTAGQLLRRRRCHMRSKIYPESRPQQVATGLGHKLGVNLSGSTRLDGGSSGQSGPPRVLSPFVAQALD